MAAYTKFFKFGEDLHNGVHNFSSHTFKVMLTNVAPVQTNSVKADLTEISAGNGYTAGGTATAATLSRSSGTTKVAFADITFTASGGSIGPFRYAVLYNDTPSSPADPLIAWHDYGSAVTLTDPDQLVWDADATTGVFTYT